MHGATPVRQRRALVERVPGGRAHALLRALAEGRRHGPEPDGGVPRDPLRPLVEPGRRGPGHRPRLPHRPEEERARAQVRVPRDGGGEDRRDDRGQAGPGALGARGRRRGAPDRDERRRAAPRRVARPAGAPSTPREPQAPRRARRRDHGLLRRVDDVAPLRAVAERRQNAARHAGRSSRSRGARPARWFRAAAAGRSPRPSGAARGATTCAAYASLANRLDRGRSYLRGGLVIDLGIARAP